MSAGKRRCSGCRIMNFWKGINCSSQGLDQLQLRVCSRHTLYFNDDPRSMQDMDVSNRGDGSLIDESLYSRQLYVMGHEAQKRMAVSDVLIVGLNGLGVETAKNIILAGVRSVTLHDETPSSLFDMSSHFYINETHLQQPRSVASVSKLAELNPYVAVSTLRGELSLNQLLSYSIVVLIDVPLQQQTILADFCHDNNIAVIISNVRGVFGSVFCDFGDAFTVFDTDGEPTASSMIASITATPTSADTTSLLITTLEETRHNLSDNDVIILSEVQGMEFLNNNQYVVTKVKDAYNLEVMLQGDVALAAAQGGYIRGGYINQVKQPVTISFRSFGSCYADPGEIVTDVTKFHHAIPLHIGFRALELFSAKHHRLPHPGDINDAEELLTIASAVNSTLANPLTNLPDYHMLLTQLAVTSRGSLSPICALMGGIVAQEVLKAASGKFNPIKQWFYYDASEILPTTPLPPHEVQPIGSRYDSQIMVIGRTLQEKLGSLNVFLVGAGAIGCEMLKNFALMGISTTTGITHCTDMDHIERSNLSRQFLFRNTDIGAAKSVTAVAAAVAMNRDFRAQPHENKVGTETEHIFDDDFYESLNFVCTALDNVEARLYVDQRCVFYHLPLLESGTLGTKGHTQVVVPYLTENYGATRDPPEKSIPVCTLKHFPNQIEHTLQWAREYFEEVFKQAPEHVNQYISTPDKDVYAASLANQHNMKLEVLTSVYDLLVKEKPRHYGDCITWARLQFEELFANRIKQLLHNFPADRINANGVPFWSGAKKPPTPLQFDINDTMHMEFVVAMADLRAYCYSIPSQAADVAAIRQVLTTMHVPPFVPSEGVKIAATDEEAKADATGASQDSSGVIDIDMKCNQMLSMLPLQGECQPVFPSDFDKDCDAHMRIVAAAGCLRARNYKIPEVDLHTARGIAGKITPAIATTTALVTGAICIELIKVLQKQPLEKYCNTFCNLALPLFTTMMPEPPAVTKSIINGKEFKFSLWDCVDITDPNMTLNGLIAHLANTYHVNLTMLSSGVSMLYSEYMNRKKMEERKTMKIRDIVQTVTKKEFPAKQKFVILEMITTSQEDDEEVELPYLRFR